MKKGLVLEGGGLRGIFTAGVLDYFNDNNIEFDYVIGVSAGACHGASFISKQPGRSKRINDTYAGDPRYIGIGNMIKTHSMFGMDFIFKEIPNVLDVFDYDTFFKNKTEFCIGATEVKTGLTEYFYKEDGCDMSTILKATSSIPIFSPVVNYKGKKYLDGGTSDPIPAQKAIEDGCDQIVVVLTQHREYKKSPEPMRRVYKRIFKTLPGMIRCLDKRHFVYSASQDYVRRLEKVGIATVIAPRGPVGMGRFENDKVKLSKLYYDGYATAKQVMES